MAHHQERDEKCGLAAAMNYKPCLGFAKAMARRWVRPALPAHCRNLAVKAIQMLASRRGLDGWFLQIKAGDGDRST